MPEISIIIVGHNVKDIISNCLDSIFNQRFTDFEIIYVDNGSSDGTVDLIKKRYLKVNLIRNERNEGFCNANNQGINISKGKHIVTVNSDVILDKNFLYEIIKAIKHFPDSVGMLGAKILKIDRRHIDSVGLVLSRAYRFFNRGEGELDYGQYDNSLDILGPCAAAALYKREMLEEIKEDSHYFDSNFFFLAEDFDLAIRAKNRSWGAKFVPEAICYHLRNGGFNHCKFRQYLSFRNRYFLIIKNGWFKFYNPLLLLIYDLPRIFLMLFTNKYIFRAIKEILNFTHKFKNGKY